MAIILDTAIQGLEDLKQRMLETHSIEPVAVKHRLPRKEPSNPKLSTPLLPISCRSCGDLFQPNVYKALFCSDKCKNNFYNKTEYRKKYKNEWNKKYRERQKVKKLKEILTRCKQCFKQTDGTQFCSLECNDTYLNNNFKSNIKPSQGDFSYTSAKVKKSLDRLQARAMPSIKPPTDEAAIEKVKLSLEQPESFNATLTNAED